eukprot:TRINITY_DN11944_c0_g1_i1.p1 TRINITY_DN11944_c0_g1~~TRINITY_DN11944_c0_g1_i1.p1  ORF type:complete len:707 (-),score=112.87 TRINITY_DN11944_c0_g1_i1:203-2323(-)
MSNDGKNGKGGTNDGALVPVNNSGQLQLAQQDGEAYHDEQRSQGSQESLGTKMERIRTANLSQCVTTAQFFLFILIFSTAMLVNQSVATSRLSDHFRLKLDPSNFRISKIDSVDTLYDYLEQVVVPTLFENTTDTKIADKISTALYPVDSSNRLLGPLRLRQARVKQKENCQVTPLFQTYTVKCYPGFSGDTASTDAFGPEGKFKYSGEEQGGVPFDGQFATYDPNGFIQYLAINVTTAVNHLRTLRSEGFMDTATRALIVEFNTWNSNIGLYAAVQLVVEFGPSGGVFQQIEIGTLTQRVLNAGGLGATDDWVAFVLLIFVMFFVVQFIFEEIQELYSSWRTYFFDAWNLLDWANMFLLLYGFTLRCLLFADAGGAGIGKEALAGGPSSQEFQNLTGYAASGTTVRVLNAFNCVLLWGKVTKYLRHLPFVKELVSTVWVAFDLFVPYLLMFLVAFLGFVMAFNIGFGDKLSELSTFTTSAMYLCRAFLKDVKLMPVYNITPLFGAALILLFYVNMMLVGLALMFAMMADALFNAKYSKEFKEMWEEKQALHEDEPVEELWRFTKSSTRALAIRFTPGLYYRYEKFVADRAAANAPLAVLGDDHQANLALEDEFMRDNDASSVSSYSDEDGPSGRPSPEELKRAIEHMSGRILSEITVVGIEIKSEIHDVCERLAQMQMAVEELAWRTDKVRTDQEVEMVEAAPDQ